MARQQIPQDLTALGAKRAERERVATAAGFALDWGSKKDLDRYQGQKALQSEVRDKNLRLKAKVVRVRKPESLPEDCRYARLVPSFSEYYEEMPDADGHDQIRRRKTKQEAMGARFTLRHPGIGSAPGERFEFRMPLDGSACTWEGPHIDAGFSSEDLICAIIADPNWCPRMGNSGYYIVTYSADEVEGLRTIHADEEWLAAQEERRMRTEEARAEMGGSVLETLEA